MRIQYFGYERQEGFVRELNKDGIKFLRWVFRWDKDLIIKYRLDIYIYACKTDNVILIRYLRWRFPEFRKKTLGNTISLSF